MPRKPKLRVIVDTNCWISFLIGRRLSKLVDLLSNERIQLIICDELLAEIQEVTTRPKLVLQEVGTCRIVDATTFERSI